MQSNPMPPTMVAKRLPSRETDSSTRTKNNNNNNDSNNNNVKTNTLIAINNTIHGSNNINREDPWPQMEKQVIVMLNDLTLQRERFREVANPTVIAENELLESIAGCQEAVQDMRFALDTAMEHPESFAISTDELQSRAERVRSWERDMMAAQKAGEKIRATQRRRLQDQDDNNYNSKSNEVGLRENNEFLQQEHAVQESIMQVDDQTLDRLHSGIHRVKDTAVNITDELNTQEHILNDIDRGMTRAQMRIDGALRKVGMLLDKTSDRGKMICIAVLILILIILIFVLLREVKQIV